MEIYVYTCVCIYICIKQKFYKTAFLLQVMCSLYILFPMFNADLYLLKIDCITYMVKTFDFKAWIYTIIRAL